MIADGLAIIPDLPVRARCRFSLQFELAWNHHLREITFADEIRDNVNIFDRVRIKKKQGVAQARFLFPKRALDIAENILPPDFRRMRKRRRARVRIHRRTMPDD